jgi:hypothetical protein
MESLRRAFGRFLAALGMTGSDGRFLAALGMTGSDGRFLAAVGMTGSETHPKIIQKTISTVK